MPESYTKKRPFVGEVEEPYWIAWLALARGRMFAGQPSRPMGIKYSEIHAYALRNPQFNDDFDQFHEIVTRVDMRYLEICDEIIQRELKKTK